jgi:hypothetical protein
MDAVYDWSRFNGLRRAYEWIESSLRKDPKLAGELTKLTIQFGNQATLRRIGFVLKNCEVNPRISSARRRLRLRSSDSVAPEPASAGGGLTGNGDLSSMTSKDKQQISLHLDTDFFRAALAYTNEETGFTPLLVEKDYYCSVLLSYLFSDKSPLVFKGGTCLSKVHVGFNPLSEDLHFSPFLEMSRWTSLLLAKKHLRVSSMLN